MTIVSHHPTHGRSARGRDPLLPDGRDPWGLRLPALRLALAPLMGPIDHTLGQAALIEQYRAHVEAQPEPGAST